MFQNIFLIDDTLKNNIAFGILEDEINDRRSYRMFKICKYL